MGRLVFFCVATFCAMFSAGLVLSAGLVIFIQNESGWQTAAIGSKAVGRPLRQETQTAVGRPLQTEIER